MGQAICVYTKFPGAPEAGVQGPHTQKQRPREDGGLGGCGGFSEEGEALNGPWLFSQPGSVISTIHLNKNGIVIKGNGGPYMLQKYEPQFFRTQCTEGESETRRSCVLVREPTLGKMKRGSDELWDSQGAVQGSDQPGLRTQLP